MSELSALQTLLRKLFYQLIVKIIENTQVMGDLLMGKFHIQLNGTSSEILLGKHFDDHEGIHHDEYLLQKRLLVNETAMCSVGQEASL